MPEEKHRTQVFISYSRKDLRFVKRLASDLRAAGLEVWYDLSRLEGGDTWPEKIQYAIDASDKFIIVISPDSIASRWVRKEFLYGTSKIGKIVPLSYKKCELPLWLLDIHFIDVEGKNYQQNFQEILDALDIPKPSPNPIDNDVTPSSGVVQRIRDAFGPLKGSKKSWLLALIPAFLVIILGVILYAQISTPTVLFYCGSNKNTHVCEYTKNQDEIRTVLDLDEAINWAPVKGLWGSTYFTSDRDGKSEIYRLRNNGEIERVTSTSGNSKSWSPTVRYDNTLYFTSNRSGKAEIYRLNRNGRVERVTNTPGKYESWSPVVGFAREVYFTSDRAGKAEIYRLTSSGKVERVTNTPAGYESWAPAYMLGGGLYFTSNRDGKSEIYRLNGIGGIERVTNTAGTSGSWAPIIRGGNVYFTSSRSGQTQVYLLKSQVISILSFEGWTNINETVPYY